MTSFHELSHAKDIFGGQMYTDMKWFMNTHKLRLNQAWYNAQMLSKVMKAKMYFYIIGLVLVVLFVVIANKYQTTKTKNVEKNGITTTGTIINRPISRDRAGMPVYSVSFDFYAQGNLIKNLSQTITNEEYFKSIVGMKYIVKYLPNKPHINSKIFISKPIKEEYTNIEKERERIEKTYKNAEVFLKKNARSINEIQNLIK